MSIEELMGIEIRHEVEGASGYEQEVSDAPADVTIVTAEDIKLFGYRTLGEILQSVRGLYMGTDRTSTTLGIRGFAPLGDVNRRMLFLVDGQRVNRNIYDNALMGCGFTVDVDRISRVEVIRGPSSSLYGNNAFFGVINVITKKGRDLNGFEGSVSTGTYETWTVRGAAGRHFTNGFEFHLSGSYMESQGVPDLYYPEYGASAQLRDGESAGNLLTTLFYADFTLQGAYSIREKMIPTAPYGTLFNDPNMQVTDTHAYVDLSYKREVAEGLELYAAGSYHCWGYEGTNPFDNSLGIPAVILNQDESTGQQAGLEVKVTQELFYQDKLLGVIEFLYTSDVLLEPGKSQTIADDCLLINATIFSQKLANGQEWSLSVYSLLNRQWDHPAGSQLIQDVILQNGRTFRLKVT